MKGIILVRHSEVVLNRLKRPSKGLAAAAQGSIVLSDAHWLLRTPPQNDVSLGFGRSVLPGPADSQVTLDHRYACRLHMISSPVEWPGNLHCMEPFTSENPHSPLMEVARLIRSVKSCLPTLLYGVFVSYNFRVEWRLGILAP